MPIIAAHHKPGHWLPKDTEYVPVCAWPDDCKVQWGGSGIVLSQKGNYKTAFFEAFPAKDAGGFIRGEGHTISDAELNAYAQFEKQIECQHRWGRRGYTNSGGRCINCGAFKSKMFKPIVKLGEWKRPVDWWTAYHMDVFDEGEPEPGNWRRTYWLRRKHFGQTEKPSDNK